MQVIPAVLVSVLFLAFGFTVSSVKADSQNLRPDKKRVVDYWTLERRHRAIPRDFVIDPRGFGYIRGKDGRLYAHGHNKEPMGKPSGGGSDNTPPRFTIMEPGEGAVIGSSHRFAATVTDDSGVKSVSFVLQYPSGQTQSFSPSKESGTDVWSINLQGFTDGNWAWWVNAKDAAGRGGNSGSSEVVNFVVDTGGGGTEPPTEPPEGVITNAVWIAGGAVQTAAGRIYFEMPNNAKRKGPWSGYVCSGTVVEVLDSGRSIILTASHCVYDDVKKAFARNVLFIPNQDDTSGSGTDTNCDNDPLGCWVPSFGVVDTKWTTSVFPNNVRWDLAYYVVNNDGAHAGAGSIEGLEEAAGALPISFLTPETDDGDPGSDSSDYTHALGYSYSEDPKFMYCAEDMTIEGSENWWLPNCGLSGGSSGGPWVQPMNEIDGSSGPVVSVNSWGYTNSPGMAGPKLSYPFAQCVFDKANQSDGPVSSADGEAGIAVDCD